MLLLGWVNEAVDTFLMYVESPSRDVGESLELMHMNESIQRARQYHVQILIIFNLSNPAPMGMHLGRFITFFDTPILCRLLWLDKITLLLSFRLLRIFLAFLLIYYVLIHSDGFIRAQIVIIVEIVGIELFIKSPSLSQRGVIPLTILKGANDFIFTAFQLLTVGLFVVFVLTNVPVGLHEVILCDYAEIISPE